MLPFSLTEKLIGGVGLLVLCVLVIAGIRHGAYKEGTRRGRAEVQAQWDAAKAKAAQDYQERAGAIAQRAQDLAIDLDIARQVATKLQQELQHARTRGTLVEFDKKVGSECSCPRIGSDAFRLWNAAAGGETPGATTPR